MHQGHPGARRGRRTTAQQARRPHRPGQGAGRQGPGVDARSTRAASRRLAGRQVPVRGRGSRRWSRPRGRAGRPAAARGRRVATRRATCSACSASSSAGRRSTRARTATCGSSTSRCSRARTTPAPRARRTTPSPCPTPTTSTSSSRRSAACSVRSQAYDLVLNGWELGSGSVRIHERIEQRMLGRCSASPTRRRSSSASCSTPFRYGAPPHAGFAFGIDRLVAILAGEENIREVIAFPKTQSGTDPLTSAPTPIDAAQLEELGLRLLPAQGLIDRGTAACRSRQPARLRSVTHPRSDRDRGGSFDACHRPPAAVGPSETSRRPATGIGSGRSTTRRASGASASASPTPWGTARFL